MNEPIGSGVQYERSGRGLSENTNKTIDYAKRYFNIFAATKELPTFDELLNNRNEILCDIGFWQQLATWLHTFARLLSDQEKSLNAAVALGFLSALTTLASRAFPDHRTFDKNSFNTWYTDIRQDVQKQILRREIRDGDDGGEELLALSPGQLKAISKRLNEDGSADALTKVCALQLSFMCVGRPGEFVYVTSEKIGFNYELQTLELWWSDRKNLTQYKIPLTVGVDKYQCALYAMAGMLLIGCTSSAVRPIDKGTFLFVKQAQTPDTAAAYLNNAVKEGVAPYVTAAELPMFVGKSLRRGGVSLLLLHKALQHDVLPALCMGNWEMQCRMFIYFGEPGKETKRAIAARALAGWQDVYCQPIPPRFAVDGVFTETVIERLVVHAYCEHLAEMAPGRRLFRVGYLLLALEVMWLAEVIAEIWGVRPISHDLLNRLPLRVRVLLDVAVKAGLGENGRTRPAVLELLMGQSIQINLQFRRENTIDHVVRTEQPPLDLVVARFAEIQRENRELRQVPLVILNS